MRAWRLLEFGDPPLIELQDVPDPSPAEGEVVVDLRAAALNRRDAWVWSTRDYCPLPVTLGSDGAGIVSAVGPGVEGVKPGDEVIFDPTLNWGDAEECPSDSFDILGAPRDGTFAERVAVPAANLLPKPGRLSWAEAASLNLAGLTAWRAVVSCAEARAGSSLLVTGAGGGVSTFAIQIAVARGARVVVTSSSQAKIDRAIELGALGGVSYLEARWPDRVRELCGAPLDAAVDGYGGPAWEGALAALRPGGRLVSFGDTSGPTTTLTTAAVYWRWRRVLGTSMGSPREYRALVAHVAAADWRPVIDGVFAFKSLPAALGRLRARERFGKVVVRIP
jgi:zinc-binding alcohol dehydrogenase/oxidoreductase